MNILTLSWHYPPDACGGTEVATRELARALAGLGHRVEIVTTGGWQCVDADCCGGVVVHVVKRRHYRAVTYCHLMVEAVRVCRRTTIDVVHAQALWMGPIALAIRLSCAIPYVLWGRGEDVRRPRMFGGPMRWVSVRCASAVLALDTSMALELTQLGACGVRVLGNGAGLTGLRAYSRREARRRLGLPGSARVVVFVGTLQQTKGVDTLLKAFTRVAASRPNARLVFVGDGRLRETLRASARATCRVGSVAFVGRVAHEDVGAYLSAADVFALPSAAEGFPMSVAEAMSSGLPLVCCPAGALSDVVRHGLNGYLVRFGDVEALSDGLASLLDNPRIAREMGRRNRAWTRRHTWSDVANRFEAVCMETVATCSPRIKTPPERFDSYGIHIR